MCEAWEDRRSVSGSPPNGSPPGRDPTAPGPGPALATWWQRVGALVLDLAVVGLLSGVVVVAIARPSLQSQPDGGYRVSWTSGTVTATLLFLLALTAYFTFLNGSRAGQTFGKAVLGIAVRDAVGGGQLGAARALVRSVTSGVLWYLAIVPWLLDGLWPLWDPRRQSLHDKTAGSVVVRVR